MEKNKSSSGWKEGLHKQPGFQLGFKDAQRRGHADLRREIIPKVRSHCREGPVSCFFLPCLPWRQALQPHLLTCTSNTGRTGLYCTQSSLSFADFEGRKVCKTLWVKVQILRKLSWMTSYIWRTPLHANSARSTYFIFVTQLSWNCFRQIAIGVQ